MMTDPIRRLMPGLSGAAWLRLSRLSLLVPVLLGPVAAYGAEGAIKNLGKGCWTLKTTYNSTGTLNPLRIRGGAATGRDALDKENKAPLMVDTGRPDSAPEFPAFRISEASSYTMAFEFQDRPAVQRFNLLDDLAQMEGVLEVTQTVDEGGSKLAVTFHGLPGRKAVIAQAILAEADCLVIRQRRWSSEETKAKRGLSVSKADPAPVKTKGFTPLAPIPENRILPR